MDFEKLKGKNVGPVKDVLNKFKYSFQGLSYCFKNETSFTFQLIAIIAIVILGIIFNLKVYEWLLTIISVFNIMTIELLNTGIEATVDMVTKKYNPYAKVAKDCGSAATCLATFIALAINLFVFVPYVLALFK